MDYEHNLSWKNITFPNPNSVHAIYNLIFPDIVVNLWAVNLVECLTFQIIVRLLLAFFIAICLLQVESFSVITTVRNGNYSNFHVPQCNKHKSPFQ